MPLLDVTMVVTAWPEAVLVLVDDAPEEASSSSFEAGASGSWMSEELQEEMSRLATRDER